MREIFHWNVVGAKVSESPFHSFQILVNVYDAVNSLDYSKKSTLATTTRDDDVKHLLSCQLNTSYKLVKTNDGRNRTHAFDLNKSDKTLNLQQLSTSTRTEIWKKLDKCLQHMVHIAFGNLNLVFIHPTQEASSRIWLTRGCTEEDSHPKSVWPHESTCLVSLWWIIRDHQIWP